MKPQLLKLALLARQTAKAAKHDPTLSDLADLLFVACKQAGVPNDLLPQ